MTWKNKLYHEEETPPEESHDVRVREAQKILDEVTEQYLLRLTPDQKKILKDKAKHFGISMADLILRAIEKLRRI